MAHKDNQIATHIGITVAKLTLFITTLAIPLAALWSATGRS